MCKPHAGLARGLRERDRGREPCGGRQDYNSQKAARRRRESAGASGRDVRAARERKRGAAERGGRGPNGDAEEGDAGGAAALEVGEPRRAGRRGPQAERRARSGATSSSVSLPQQP